MGSGHSLDVALVTWRGHPELDPDDEPLGAALGDLGLSWRAVAWDDLAMDWAAARIVVLRSTWDYLHRRDEWLAWADRAAAMTRLWNPVAALRWNSHKGYLAELEARGVPVVPTVHLPAGSRGDFAAIARERGWPMAVVKPAVSADSWATARATADAPGAGQELLDRHLPERDMMVQAFMSSVEDAGERSLCFIDGALSHAVRKRSLFQGGRHAGPEGVPVAPAADEAAVATQVLAVATRVLATTGPLLYARVDLVRDAAGSPRLLELELCEPTLFLRDHPAAARRLAEAIRRRAPTR